ncbi:MAG: mechanosensitive ion channel family protein [Ignavibacteria bacterium]|nr:mechanosensitive ion channel family protein [Ignavibacteria bacterium]MBP6510552.1 mechanosensitive ion channel family protein [Candidatus Kapabacteria bacterium]MBK6420149.1 mechanosensitive ion channel family protein [Ignavibacteria bacterium]MBK6759215.1 mechanosensitive ion channel family protein [Ignavibacteria bacterium]MBK7034346.1 mechanosensitive ion channel family protein [Ignavibacteria bacterium]
MDFAALWTKYESSIVNYLILVVGAVLMWMVGRWLIGFVINMIRRALTARNVDATLQNYLASIIAVSLNIILVIAILARFGVETTSFAALIAAAGLAIGMAWGGLLANFAAGAFLLVLRPFKVGDLIKAGGVLGTVEEIGLFSTTMMTPDGIRAMVSNGKIFSDNIENMSHTPYRRVDREMQLAHGVDVDRTIARIKELLASETNVLASPAPAVWVLDFTLAGPVLCVRPFCLPEHYWNVYEATNNIIRTVGGELGLPVPQVHYNVQQRN